MVILRVLIAAEGKRHQQQRHHGKRPCRTQLPPGPEPPLPVPVRRFGLAFDRCLVHPCHHALGETLSRIFALERCPKIVFREMHIEPLSTCVSAPAAALPANGAACSSPCSPASPALRRSPPDPGLPGTAGSPPCAAAPATRQRSAAIA